MVELNSFTVKYISYIKARDPSLLCGNFAVPSTVRRRLCDAFTEEASTESETNKDHIEIYVRLRDNSTKTNNFYEITETSITCTVPKTSQWYRTNRKTDGSLIRRTFNFSKIFPTTSNQSEIFNYIVKPKLFKFINGEDSTLLTYGISGSGKTFTIMGTDENPGIIPRAFEYLFNTIKVSSKPHIKPLPNGEIQLLNGVEIVQERKICENLISNSASMKTNYQKQYLSMQSRLSTEPVAIIDNESDIIFEIWVSFAEIYNENIYDLFQTITTTGGNKNKSRQKLRLGLTNNGRTYIKDLTIINVKSSLEAYQLMQIGLQHLNYASTKLNQHSSRSHAIFTVKLIQIMKCDNSVCISNFHFTDLAGSERSKKTMNVGDRLKESNNINLSLLVLSRCIKNIYQMQQQQQQLQQQQQIPYRESKLTQIFQNALSGNENICLIVNVNLNAEMFDETLNTLNLATLAQDINVVNIEKKKNKYKKLPMTISVKNDEENNDNNKNRRTYTATTTASAPSSSSSSSSTDDYIEELENAVALLQNDLIQQRIEFEDNELLEHERLVRGFHELLENKDNYWRDRLDNEINYLNQQHRKEIELLRDEYENKLCDQEEFFLKRIRQIQAAPSSSSSPSSSSTSINIDSCNDKSKVIVISDSSDDDDDDDADDRGGIGNGDNGENNTTTETCL